MFKKYLFYVFTIFYFSFCVSMVFHFSVVLVSCNVFDSVDLLGGHEWFLMLVD